MNSIEKPLELRLKFVRSRGPQLPHGYGLQGSGYWREVRDSVYTEPVMLDVDRLQGRWEAYQAARLDDEALLALGRELRTALSPAELAGDEERIRQARRAGQPIRLTLQFPSAELYDIPWELLVLRGDAEPLAAGPCLLRYRLPDLPAPEQEAFKSALKPEAARSAPEPDAARTAPRLLFAWSDAGGRVPHRVHLEALITACREGGVAFDPVKDVLPDVTLPVLLRALEEAERENPVSILHILCHGATERSGGETTGYGLAWRNARGHDKTVISGMDLEVHLRPFASMLRLAVVSACHGGGTPHPGSQVGSVAQGLHRAGLEAVIASRIPLSVAGSHQFTQAFYHALLSERSSVDEAFLAARRLLFLHRRDGGPDNAPPGLDYAALQLYSLRAPGGETHVFPRQSARESVASGTPPVSGGESADSHADASDAFSKWIDISPHSVGLSAQRIESSPQNVGLPTQRIESSPPGVDFPAQRIEVSPCSFDVFVTYAAEDYDRIAPLAALIQAQGLSVFLDEWVLDFGDVVQRRVDAAILESRNGIVAVSTASMRSPRVQDEYARLINRAIDHGVRVVPVLLEDVPLPPFLRARRPFDLRDPAVLENLRLTGRLIETLRKARERRP